MADNPDSAGGGNLPPKLDLRKIGAVKPGGGQPPAPTAAPGVRPAFTPRVITPTAGPRPLPLGNLPPMSANTTTPINITPASAAPLTPKKHTVTLSRPGSTAAPNSAPNPAGSPATVPQGPRPGPTPTGRSIPMAEPQVQTVHIKIPKVDGTGSMVPPGKSEAPTVMGQQRAPTQPPGDAKKETSKIPLAAAKPMGGPTVMSTPPTDGPKTIRIKPKPATAQTQKVAQAGILAEEEDDSDSDSADIMGSKRKTSRISLEAALTPDQMPGAPGSTGEAARPKTIRLKRPSEAATVRVASQPGIPAEQDIPTAAAAIGQDEPLKPAAVTLEETSRLDMPPPPEEEGSPTRRKTIKVKRPTQRPDMAGPSGAPGAAGSAGLGEVGGRRPARAALPMVKPDTMNATFPVFAVVAMIIIMVTIYLFCTEALGPNPCLTDYSYYKEGPDLSWPGKISPYTR